jgi:phage tail-like protein
MTAGFSFPGATTAIMNAPAAVGAALTTSARAKGPATVPEYGLTMWFNVRVTNPDGTKDDLGLWSSCTGLGVKLDIQEVWSAYNLNAPYLVPHRISYDQITLQRAMEADSSLRIRNWLKKVAAEWINHPEGGAGLAEVAKPASSGGYTGTTVTIALYCSLDSNKAASAQVTGARKGGGPTEVASWVLVQAVPVHWAGPALNSKGGDVAIETLKIAHRGWLGEASAGGAGAPPKAQGVFRLSNEKDLKDNVEFQYSPEKVKLENTVESRGDAKQVLASDITSASEYNKWNVTINQLHVEGATKVKEVREKLRAWMDSQIASTMKGSTVPAPRLTISFGAAATSDIPTVNLKSVTIDLVRFTADGTPNRAMVTISVVAAKEPGSWQKPERQQGPQAQPRAGAHRDLRKENG